MYYNRAKDGNLNRDFIDTFGGFNHNLRIGENEFYDCLNISSHHYPLMESRGFSAGKIPVSDNSKGIICNGYLYEAVESSGYLNLIKHNDDTTTTSYTLGYIETENVGKERQLINFGAYIIVMPDKLYFNTADTTESGKIEKRFTNTDATNHYNKWYVIKPCDIDGNEYIADYYGATEPTTDLYDGYVWYDTSSGKIKTWSPSYSMWITPTIYHKYRIDGIGIFKEGESVKFTCYRNGQTFSSATTIIKAFTRENPSQDTSENTVPMDADFIVIPASDDTDVLWNRYNQTIQSLYNQWRTFIVFEQIMPKTDYLCECQGRLWGCRYGDTEVREYREYRQSLSELPTSVEIDIKDNAETVDEVLTYWLYNSDWERLTTPILSIDPEKQTDKKIIIDIDWNGYTATNASINVDYSVKKTKKLNEIYSSKQQDFKSWNYYQGTALDSYTASIGASGKWTGCINYNGKPLFSKEDRMIVVYGSYPAQYQTQENVFEGVADGRYKSMVVYNGVLFYMGNHGIYMYSGGLPKKISQAFGDLKFRSYTGTLSQRKIVMCAGAFNGFYKIYLEGAECGGFYEYDIEKGIWTRSIVKIGSRTVKPIQMVSSPSCLYCLGFTDAVSNNAYICKLENDDKTDEQRDFGDWYAETGLIGLNTPDEKYIKKISIRYKGAAKVKIKYDSSGNWSEEYSLTGGLTSKTFTIIPRRCDHFQLRFEGTTEAPMFKLYSISKTIDEGSDETYGNI